MLRQKFKMNDIISAQMQCNPELDESMRFYGYFRAECFDKDGNLKWVEEGKNLITNQGLDHALQVLFTNSGQVTTWYVGTKEASGGHTATDVLSAHPGWVEAENYSGNRKEYVEGSVSGQSISNVGSPASFTITGSGTIAGGFLCNVEDKTVDDGILWCVSDFTVTRTVDAADVVNISYTINASSA